MRIPLMAAATAVAVRLVFLTPVVAAQEFPSIPPTKESVCPDNNPVPLLACAREQRQDVQGAAHARRQAGLFRVLGRHAGARMKTSRHIRGRLTTTADRASSSIRQTARCRCRPGRKSSGARTGRSTSTRTRSASSRVCRATSTWGSTSGCRRRRAWCSCRKKPTPTATSSSMAGRISAGTSCCGRAIRAATGRATRSSS